MASKIAFTTPTLASPNTNTNANATTPSSRGGSKTWKSDAGFWEAVYSVVAICYGVEAVLILATNLFLLLLLVTSSSLRSQRRYQLLMSLVVANLFVGVFSSPFAVDYSVKRDWAHGCYFQVVRTLVVAYVQHFVMLWGVVLMLLHYIARLKSYEGPAWRLRVPAWLWRAAGPLYVALPWVVAVVLVTSILFGGLHSYAWIIWTETRCPIILQQWAKHLLFVICFFIPSVLLLVLIAAVVVLHRRHGGGGAGLSGAEMGSRLVAEDKDAVEPPLVHVLTAVLTLVLMAPASTFYFLMRSFIKVHWRADVISGIALGLLVELLSFLLPLIWLITLADVRDRVALVAARLRCSLCYRPRSPPQAAGDTSVAPVAFRDLQDE